MKRETSLFVDLFKNFLVPQAGFLSPMFHSADVRRSTHAERWSDYVTWMVRKTGATFSVGGLIFSVLFVTIPDGWAQVTPAKFVFTGDAKPTRKATFRQIFQQEGLQVGPIQIHPFLGLAEVYTDNVFRSKRSRKSDFIHTIAPEIQALGKLGARHRFVVDYPVL